MTPAGLLFRKRLQLPNCSMASGRMSNVKEAMNTLRIHIGDSFDGTKSRALDAVARRERGDDVEEHHLSFENWQTFARVMTANRLAFLQRVHGDRPRSIHALATALGRDYRRVHGDVEALAAAGLLDRDGAGLRAEYDSIQIAI